VPGELFQIIQIVLQVGVDLVQIHIQIQVDEDVAELGHVDQPHRKCLGQDAGVAQLDENVGVVSGHINTQLGQDVPADVQSRLNRYLELVLSGVEQVGILDKIRPAILLDLPQ